MVSIITCTKRPEFIPAILNNYKRQNIKDKELILVIHDNEIPSFVNFNNRITILNCDSRQSLGCCLNKAMMKARYSIIARFDDDDYYGSEYLTEAIEALEGTNAQIIGKASFYVYFKEDGHLSIMRSGKASQYIMEPCLAGSTLVFRKEILSKVLFPDLTVGEDFIFLNECLQKGMTLYSTSCRNYTYIRYSDAHHTSDVGNARLRKCLPRSIQTTNYRNVADVEEGGI